MYLKLSEIVKDDSPLIRQRSKNVELPLNNEDKALLEKMLAHVRNSQDSDFAQAHNITPAVGIAAIQVGVPKKMLAVVVHVDEDEIVELALVNARIISESVQKIALEHGEGCLSVPGEHKGLVPRSMRIKVRAYDLITDQEIEFTAEDYLAVVLQHEIDHFSGRLFYDRINKTNPWQQDDDLELI